MQEKKFFKGIYGTNSIEFAQGLINVQGFGDVSKQYHGRVKPHIHNNLLQVFLIEEGSTEFYYGAGKALIKAPAFIAVPKNKEHGFVHQTNVEGWIISLADTVLEHMLQQEAEVVFGMDEIRVVSVTPAAPATVELFRTMQQCVKEYRAQLPGRLLMLQYLVGQMLVQLYRLSANGQKSLVTSDNSSKVYFRRFQQLIKEGNSYKKSVKEYARVLLISAGHLSRICRSIAGKSPKDIIIDYFITEAQFALTDVDRSISAISFSLGFDDPAYFARLFKKRTGLTPMAFRKQLGVIRS
ncbi:helix-turn-helix domain-containing protein [Botryobacter ruber]|uniref:helix-turn-helix domain-containing protein n=1 Tax=Botryobacter ruber TaxID=2171629 RepID=UPI000E0BED96|nr:helix-turn-helix domain-containing protein [Botryobacter ruber]